MRLRVAREDSAAALELLGRALLHQSALLQHQEAISLGEVAQPVRHADHRHLLLPAKHLRTLAMPSVASARSHLEAEPGEIRAMSSNAFQASPFTTKPSLRELV